MTETSCLICTGFTSDDTHTTYFFCSASLGGSGFGVGSLNCDGLDDVRTLLTSKAYLIRLPVCSRANLLPSCRSTSEVPVCLGHLQRLHYDSFLLLVVSDLGVSRHGKVLSQRVAVEAVVCHYSPQVGVASEKDTEQIVDFALVPICTIVKAAKRWYGRGFISVRLYPYARVMSDGKKVVHDLEALVLRGIIYRGDVGYLRVLSSCVVLEESKYRDDTGGWDVNSEFVLPDGESEARLARDGGRLTQHTAEHISAYMTASTGRTCAMPLPSLRICRRDSRRALFV